MGLTTVVGLWMLVKMNAAGATGGNDSYQTIGYFRDQTECAVVAATEKEWKCMKRPDFDDAMKNRGDRFKLD